MEGLGVRFTFWQPKETAMKKDRSSKDENRQKTADPITGESIIAMTELAKIGLAILQDMYTLRQNDGCAARSSETTEEKKAREHLTKLATGVGPEAIASFERICAYIRTNQGKSAGEGGRNDEN